MQTADVFTALGISVIAGLISAALCFLFVVYYRRVILPWMENLAYKGAKIEGAWHATVNYDYGTSEELWDIKRTGHAIVGVVTVISGADKGSAWDVFGEIQNDLITITYVDRNKANIDRGCLTLSITDYGKKLKGKQSYYDGKEEFKVTDYECERK